MFKVIIASFIFPYKMGKPLVLSFFFVCFFFVFSGGETWPQHLSECLPNASELMQLFPRTLSLAGSWGLLCQFWECEICCGTFLSVLFLCPVILLSLQLQLLYSFFHIAISHTFLVISPTCFSLFGYNLFLGKPSHLVLTV